MEKPTAGRDWRFNIGYLLFALIGILILQQIWEVHQQTEVVPYSEFATCCARTRSPRSRSASRSSARR